MQIISNVPFKELRIGDRVKSQFGPMEGFIYKLINIENSRGLDDNEIIIKWENNGLSLQYHCDHKLVWLM